MARFCRENMLVEILNNCQLNSKALDQILNKIENKKYYTELRIKLLDKNDRFLESFSLYMSSGRDIKRKAPLWLIKVRHRIPKGSELEKLKTLIFSNLESLITLDPESAYGLVNAWFQNPQVEVIQRLHELPQVQLEYLNEFVQHNEARIRRLGLEDADRAMLKLQMQLLLQHSQREIISYLQKKIYKYEDCIELFKKTEYYEGLAMLFHKQGSYSESMKYHYKIMDKHYTILQDTHNKMDFEENAEQLTLSFNYAIQTATKNSYVEFTNPAELFFELLDYFYQKLQTVYTSPTEESPTSFILTVHKAFCQQISSKIQEFINDLIFHITNILPAGKVMEILSSKYGELTMEPLKSVIYQMVSGYSHLESTYEAASKIFSIQVGQEMVQYYNELTEGNIVNNPVCNICDNKIYEESITIYQCGHIYHEKCAIKYSSCPQCISSKANEETEEKAPELPPSDLLDRVSSRALNRDEKMRKQKVFQRHLPPSYAFINQNEKKQGSKDSVN